MPFITGNVIGTIADGMTEGEFNDATGQRVVHVVSHDVPNFTIVRVSRTLTPLEIERWVLYLNEVLR